MISMLLIWLIVIAVLELWLINRVQKVSKLDKTGKIAKFVQTKLHEKLLLGMYYYNYTILLFKPSIWPANKNIRSELSRLRLLAILLMFLIFGLPIVTGVIWVTAPQVFYR